MPLANAQEASPDGAPALLRGVDTRTPRATMRSLFDEVEDAFAARAQSDNQTLVDLLSKRAINLLDLSALPSQ
ncbi:MAG: hypothetical protein AAFY56_04400, partial [Pseudomonadota bacterium]